MRKFTKEDFNFHEAIKKSLPVCFRRTYHEESDYAFTTCPYREDEIGFDIDLTAAGVGKLNERMEETGTEYEIREASFQMDVLYEKGTVRIDGFFCNYLYSEDKENPCKMVDVNKTDARDILDIIFEHYGSAEDFIKTARKQHRLAEMRREDRMCDNLMKAIYGE